jgi:hypothetical protein
LNNLTLLSNAQVHLLYGKHRIVVPKYLDGEESEFEISLLFYGTKWAALAISYREMNRLYFLFQKAADTRKSIQMAGYGTQDSWWGHENIRKSYSEQYSVLPRGNE